MFEKKEKREKRKLAPIIFVALALIAASIYTKCSQDDSPEILELEKHWSIIYLTKVAMEIFE